MPGSRSLLKRAMSLLLIAVMTVVLAYDLGRALTPVTYADFYNHEMNLLEDSGAEIDLLMVGDSRLYSSFDPHIFEEKLGLKNVVVASTASQPICGSYYIIKDMIERMKPKKIILGLDCGEMMEEDKVQGMLLVIDRLSPKYKLEMFRHCFYGTDLFYMLDLYRYRNNLDEMLSNISARKAMVANNWVQEDDGDSYYSYKGFIYRHGSVGTGNMPMYSHSTFSEDSILQTNVDYLDKCVELCKENGIELELISAPTTVMRMYYVDNYKGAVEYYQNYADAHGLVYHNLNYLMDRETILPDEMMCDYNHTNGEGAKVVSELFAEILLKESKGKDVSSFFYPTYEDFCASVKRIVAVDAKIKKENDAYKLTFRSCRNPDVEVLYQVETADGKVLIPWTAETEQTISGIEGTIKVLARAENEGISGAYQIYDLSNY
ncbi:MAG: hypothetical protein IKS69_00145 [Erysipelotrichaceae bacterium]|nr:hypothetical protein [Erysipelotrichaceae bacterium]